MVGFRDIATSDNGDICITNISIQATYHSKEQKQKGKQFHPSCM